VSRRKKAVFGLILLLGVVILIVRLTGCNGAPPRISQDDNIGAGAGEKTGAFPGTAAGARALLGEFLKPGADCAALTRELRPGKLDYVGVFKGDVAARMESALGAVLENAAKYRDQANGPQEIDLCLSRLGDEARIEIADRGVGIPSGEHARVFDSFYRATNVGARRGVGLGLHLVRRFAEAHGGRAEALPRDGGGTIVRISLPAISETAANAEDQHPGDRGRA